MKQCTLVFLVKREAGQVRQVCLALKKRGWGQGNWNGVGGKLEAGETFEQGAVRETREELGVVVSALDHVADLTFHYPAKPEQDLLVKVYLTDTWTGEPKESEEVRPEWFLVENIPFGQMWQDDALWLSRVLAGEKLSGEFDFDLEHNMLSYKVSPGGV